MQDTSIILKTQIIIQSLSIWSWKVSRVQNKQSRKLQEKKLQFAFRCASIRLDQDTGTFPAKSFLRLDSLILAAPNIFQLDTAIWTLFYIFLYVLLH